MKFERSSGVLLHISSLPGFDGIGDFGDHAYQFIDFLHSAGTKLWQVLPLNPTGYGNSPYQGLSASAGNPLFISIPDLQKKGLLENDDLRHRPGFPDKRVDYEKVTPWKMGLLQKAFKKFNCLQPVGIAVPFKEFCRKNRAWLGDYALYATIKNRYELKPWDKWPISLRFRDRDELDKFEKEHAYLIEEQKFFQFLFYEQWKNLRAHAKKRGIKIIGDIPIFVGYDCADTWKNPELFFFDEKRKPTVVAGVPPDFFSKTGQLWGNPLYDWEKHKQESYAWWIARIENTLKQVDIIRLDHFRGFAGYYEIPADAKTAEFGRWVDGPGRDLFDAIYNQLGDVPLIAEDLGVITPDVIELRDRYRLPGMKILQFAFGPSGETHFLPHNYTQNSVAYTGTHDNTPLKAWYKEASLETRDHFKEYSGHTQETSTYAMIRMLWASSANVVVVPMQDLLDLPEESRMNFPGTLGGNWEWKLSDSWFDNKIGNYLSNMNKLYGR